jgi:hypothetical protein
MSSYMHPTQIARVTCVNLRTVQNMLILAVRTVYRLALMASEPTDRKASQGLRGLGKEPNLT